MKFLELFANKSILINYPRLDAFISKPFFRFNIKNKKEVVG